MKNMKKLVALFAATVMAMSVSVSAFAATVETTVAPDNADIADGAFNLVFAAPEGGEADVDQLTMIAYLVPAETTLETWVAYDGTQPVVAINQVGGDVGFGSVPVDVAKLAEGKSIAVAIGGTDVGTTAKYLVTYTTAPQIVTYTIVYNLADGTAEGNPGESNSEETIADFFAKVVAPTKDGYTFLHWSKTADGEAIETASTEKMSTLLDDAEGTTVTLCAVYEKNAPQIVSYAVEYKLADGTAEGNPTASNSEETIADFFAKVVAPTKDGYTFLHWSKTDDGEAIETASTEKMSTLLDDAEGTTVTLYAVYEEEEDPVVIIVGDVNGDKSVTIADYGLVLSYCAAADKDAFNTNNDKSIGVDMATGLVIGDVNGDNTVTIADYGLILSYCAAADKDAFNANNSKIIGEEKSSK